MHYATGASGQRRPQIPVAGARNVAGVRRKKLAGWRQSVAGFDPMMTFAGACIKAY